MPGGYLAFCRAGFWWLRTNRHLGADARAFAGGAPDPQAPVQRLDAVGEAAQPRTELGVGATDSVVDDLDENLAVAPATSTVTDEASAYFATFARHSETR